MFVDEISRDPLTHCTRRDALPERNSWQGGERTAAAMQQRLAGGEGLQRLSEATSGEQDSRVQGRAQSDRDHSRHVRAPCPYCGLMSTKK